MGGPRVLGFALTACAVGLVAPVAVPDEPAPAPAKTYDLAFFPADGQVLRFRPTNVQTWDYRPEPDMNGTLRTELTLRWTFTRGGSAAAVQGKAAIERAYYQGKGGKLGKPFDIDIEWNATDGYLRGKDSGEDKTWVAKELAQGVRLMIDRRGWCDEGEC